MDPGADGDYISPVSPRPPGRSGLKWLGVLAGFAVLVGVVVLQRHSGNAPAAVNAPTPTGSATAPASSSPPPAGTGTTAAPIGSSTTPTYPITAPFTGFGGGPPPETSATEPATNGLATTVATLPPPLPRVSAGWEIDGFSSVQGLLRIDPTTGHLVRIAAPASGTLASPQSFVSVPGQSIVAGFGDDGVTDLLFPDGGPATTASGALRDATVVLPGPDPAHLWIWDSDPSTGPGGPTPTVVLINWDGIKTTTSIALPVYLAASRDPQPDGSGYLMMTGVGGTYDVRPGSITLITHGVVLAAGPTTFLAYECGDTPACRTVVVDRATGDRRVIPSVPVSSGYFLTAGSVAPDGSHAAYADIAYSSTATTARLIIVDLASGATHVAAAPLSTNATVSGGFAFSPDGKHLAMVADGGDVGIVDVASGAVRTLGVTSAAGYFLSALTVRDSR